MKPLEQGKNSKIMVEYRSLSSSMETRDHSKNGASPKSQMIRGNLKIFTILVFVVSAFVLVSCNKDEKEFEDERVTTIEEYVFRENGSPFTDICNVSLYHTLSPAAKLDGCGRQKQIQQVTIEWNYKVSLLMGQQICQHSQTVIQMVT